jgi:prepilin-type N-terminal cleavage/methylation domain-containing protein
MPPSHIAPRAQRSPRLAGFSLIELMVVVAITGVLASIAMPTFTSYVYRARTSEATQFLGIIKLRQEAYRAEFGAYYTCAGAEQVDEIAFVPGNAEVMKDSTPRAFPTDNACFNELGARPDGFVRFGYGWAAGAPGALDAASKTTYNIPDSADDHYFIAQAVTDLDGDGTACLFELTSVTTNIWVGKTDGTALPAGWE